MEDLRINVSKERAGVYYEPLPLLIRQTPQPVVYLTNTTHYMWDFYLYCRENRTSVHYHIGADNTISQVLEEQYTCLHGPGIIVAVHEHASEEAVAALVADIESRFPITDSTSEAHTEQSEVAPKVKRSRTRTSTSTATE